MASINIATNQVSITSAGSWVLTVRSKNINDQFQYYTSNVGYPYISGSPERGTGNAWFELSPYLIRVDGEYQIIITDSSSMQTRNIIKSGANISVGDAKTEQIAPIVSPEPVANVTNINMYLSDSVRLGDRNVTYQEFNNKKALIIVGSESAWMGYYESRYFFSDFYVQVREINATAVSLHIEYGKISSVLPTVTTPFIPDKVTTATTGCAKIGDYPKDWKDSSCCEGKVQNNMLLSNYGKCVADPSKVTTECSTLGTWNLPGTGPKCCGETEGKTKRSLTGTCEKDPSYMAEHWGAVNGVCVKTLAGLYSNEADCKTGETAAGNIKTPPSLPKTYRCINGKVVEFNNGLTYVEAEKGCKTDYTLYAIIGGAIILMMLLMRK